MTMIGNHEEQEWAELYRNIWNIVNALHGIMVFYQNIAKTV